MVVIIYKHYHSYESDGGRCKTVPETILQKTMIAKVVVTVKTMKKNEQLSLVENDVRSCDFDDCSVKTVCCNVIVK